MTLQLMAIACSTTVLILLVLSCGLVSSGDDDIRIRDPVIPACSGDSGSASDPCQRRYFWTTQPHRESHGDYFTPPLPIDPEWLYRLEWSRQGVNTPQIVVRGVVTENSARCSEVRAYNFGHGDYGRVKPGAKSTLEVCHIDIDVSEYIAGSGPHRVPVVASWRNAVDRSASDYGTSAYFAEVAAPVGDTFEGIEFIIELARPHDLAWGDWIPVHVWDIQRRSDGTVVGQSAWWTVSSGTTDIEDWEIPIDELQPRLKAAHAKVTTEYGGRISDEPDSPILVTNASRSHLLAQLRELGAYDAPDITPVPAPPAPILPIEPGDVTATQPNAEGGILISWSASPSGDAIGYKIVRRVPNGEFVTVIADTESTATTYADTSAPMTAGTTYIYRVLALNEYGESVASRPASVRVP